MSRTYKVTGINLKSMPLGEADRLVTILTPEFGLIKAVAPGSRKHKSKLRGRSELFVVNELLIAKGRSLDKITQAETIESYPGLSKNLGKLAVAQYLAELVICVSLSEQPQTELYQLLNEHLRRLDCITTGSNLDSSASIILSHLCQAIFHLLAIAGIAPVVGNCCLTQQPLTPDFTNAGWRVGFSFEAGGTIALPIQVSLSPSNSSETEATERRLLPTPRINSKLNAVELTGLQQLGTAELPQFEKIIPKRYLNTSVNTAWIEIERLLRDYTEYQLGKSIRSAILVDSLYPLPF
ncbi:DNA repair protein RecO [Oscillatoria salina]|uniref:DNA repair protein RecO n=1 Tax=Oscillatoria salina TaxID=331517 RepID=UPI0013BCBE86|nr:DNA repair protein RecO [Oscillatoria salina]MBZ8179674.1 DNA repair protein RecO [Oscillatoria salina IIICB1]NET90205.1 DNA repair protein RecO [Kamptonema sp. SIO1D9]